MYIMVILSTFFISLVLRVILFFTVGLYARTANTFGESSWAFNLLQLFMEIVWSALPIGLILITHHRAFRINKPNVHSLTSTKAVRNSVRIESAAFTDI